MAQVKIGSYRLGKTIGVGSFGKVKTAVHEATEIKVAVKVVNRKKAKAMEMNEKIRREIQILKNFSHPHIIRLYEVINTPSDIFMVVEFVPNGELFEFIVANGKMAEDNARRFFQQIISAVDYCHKRNIVHRDLKPENILLDSNYDVKIVDFGLSNLLVDGEFLRTSCGSPNYAAPEVIMGNLYCGPEVDVWSCGVILYALLCGRLPFDDEYIPNLFKKIKSGVFHSPGFLSDSARDLIGRMLNVNPMGRITVNEIKAHPWYNVHIPGYLSHYQKAAEEDTPEIDTESVDKTSRALDVSANTIRAVLSNAMAPSTSIGDLNQISVTYQLLYDQKLKSIMESSKKGLSPMILPFKLPAPEKSSTFEPIHPESNIKLSALDKTAATATTQSLPNGTIHGHVSSSMSKGTWTIGFRSTLHPADLLAEVYRVLKVCRYEWKTVHHFEIRCKATRNYHGINVLVKFCVRIFRLDELRCMVDLHNLAGCPMHFLDICSNFLGHVSPQAMRAP